MWCNVNDTCVQYVPASGSRAQEGVVGSNRPMGTSFKEDLK